MKNALRGFASALAVLALAASFWLPFGSSASAQEVTLKLHQFLPPQANVPKHILEKWIADAEAAANGKLKVEHYPSMQLGGKPPELIDQAIDGVADIVWTVVGYTPGRFSRTEAFELPFMMTNAEAVSRAFWEFVDKNMKDEEFKDVHLLGAWAHGPGLIHSDRPVRSPDDLKGMKVRGASRSVTLMLDHLGATSVGMPITQTSEALSKGVVNAVTMPWEVTPALKTTEFVSNHTEFDGPALYTVTFVLAMNKDKYDSLPSDVKKAIDSVSGMEFSAFAGKTQEAYDAPGRKAALERGNNIVSLSESESEAWHDAVAGVYDAWSGNMDSRGHDGKALIEEARSLIEKHSK